MLASCSETMRQENSPAPRNLAAVDSFLNSFADEDVPATTVAAFAATSDGAGAMTISTMRSATNAEEVLTTESRKGAAQRRLGYQLFQEILGEDQQNCESPAKKFATWDRKSPCTGASTNIKCMRFER